ncbi:MAG: NAD(P)/FAD-dependent oxidoreductase [Clostridia bacterium]|nr:NAD(P)/FAD-dependent oxidoreductase [Clostridia bacterium]
MYDLIIVGAGPTGIFAGVELMNKGKKIAIIDAGVDLSQKICYIETEGKCKFCKPTCNILGGYGGAQFFEGTKLSVYPAGSGFVNFCGSIEKTKDIYNYVDEILEKYGKQKREYPNEKDVNELKEKFKNVGIDMKYYNAQKVSKQTMNKIANNIKDDLIANGIEIFLEEQVIDVVKQDKYFEVITNKATYKTKKILLAVGRIGSRQLTKIADSLGIKYEDEEQEIEIGIRIEAPYKVFNKINNLHNDLKLKIKVNENEELRTFCQDYKGYITKCVYNLNGDKVVSSLDGHIIGTDEEGGTLSEVVNLAVHHRYKVDYSIDEIYKFISKINKKGKPIIQSLKNFMNNSDSENILKNKLSMPDVFEDNINNYLPQRTCELLKDFILKIDKVLPGFADGTNTVYAPSFEMGWKKFEIDNSMETNIKGIYIGGDATGHFRGAVQSMASGIIIAREILK